MTTRKEEMGRRAIHAYDALDFFRVTPLINISNGKPSDMSLYDWLPMYEASGGQAAEEIWLQTFLGYEPASQKYYKKSNPLPPVDKVSWKGRSLH